MFISVPFYLGQEDINNLDMGGVFVCTIYNNSCPCVVILNFFLTILYNIYDKRRKKIKNRRIKNKSSATQKRC